MDEIPVIVSLGNDVTPTNVNSQQKHHIIETLIESPPFIVVIPHRCLVITKDLKLIQKSLAA